MADERPDRYATLELDPSTMALVIPYRLIYGVDAIVQRLRIRFSFFRGEWFLNLRDGIPYFQAIFDKPNPDVARAVFSQVILETPGIVRLLSLDFYVVNKNLRHWKLEFRAEAATGDIIDTKNYPKPFLVGSPT